MSGFSPTADGASAWFGDGEVQLLSSLLTQFSELLRERGGRGSDPAIDRLLPDAYRDNTDFAAEFRRFTETDLVDAKLHNAATVRDALTEPEVGHETHVVVDFTAAQAWLRALTDLRLTLAARLDVGRNGETSPSADEVLVSVYDWLGYLQESLVEAIDR
jgi:hypothetical protein